MSAPSTSNSLSSPSLDLDSCQLATVSSERPGGSSSSHVRAVIREQFASEVSYKEEELERIEERIHLAKMMLQRLRLGVLAQHYGVAAFYPTALDYREETVGEQHNWETFEEELVTRQDAKTDSGIDREGGMVSDICEDGVRGDSMIGKEIDDDVTSVDVGKVKMSTSKADVKISAEKRNSLEDSPVTMETGAPAPSLPNMDTVDQDDSIQDSRFYFKKRIIIGNTSQYLDPTAHHVAGDGSTHKWMVYVRGSQTEPDISHFVKAVRFFLHPSYHPNDIVRVHMPPFHLTRLGWGEFPVRVQLEFVDKANKSVDIIHNLVLDRTHTGQQTLGAETLVDLDIVAPPQGEGKGFRLNGLSTTCTTVRSGDGENSERGGSASLSSTSIRSHSYTEDLPFPSSSHSSLSPDIHMQTDPTLPPVWTENTPPPPPLSSTGVGVLTTNLDKCLHNTVRTIPIYGKPNPSQDFYIPAPSLSQFRLWHIGRRRATEWQRAVAIRKAIEKKLKVPSLLSTKQVMQWCRQNGYTPLDPLPPSGRGFCKVCGCQLEAGLDEEDDEWGEEGENESSDGVGVSRRCPEVHEHCQLTMFGRQGLPLRGNTMDPFEELHPDIINMEPDEPNASLPRLSSLSQPHDMVASLFSRQVSLEEQAKKQEEDVDVCAMPPSPSCARSRALVDMVPRFRVPQTPELKWVQQTAASIGIHIYPAVLDRMYAHVVEHMIYISCARFLRGILGQAVQGAGQMLEGKLSQDRVLTPFHLQQAILKLEHCDFLTNRYLGVQSCLTGGVERGSLPSNTCSTVSSCSSDSSSEEEEGREP